MILSTQVPILKQKILKSNIVRKILRFFPERFKMRHCNKVKQRN